METNAEDGVITITPCKTKQDCIRHIRTVGCSASVVYCSQGYCRCNHMSGIQIYLFFTIKYNMLI